MPSIRIALLSCIATLLAPLVALAHAPHDPVWVLAVSPAYGQDQTLLIGQTGSREWRTMELLMSRNGGETWATSPKGFDNVAPITSCVTSPAFTTDHAILCTTFGEGVFRSLDAGLTWERASAGLAIPRVMTAAMALDANGTTVAWVTTVEGALYSSTNLGQTWTQVAVPITVSAVAASGDYATDETVIVGSFDGGTALSDNGGLAGTSTWSAQAFLGNETINVLVLPRGFSSHGTVFAGTSGGLFRSEDFGFNYQLNGSIPSEHVQAIVASPSYATDNTVFAASANEGVFRSTNGGDNWTEFPHNIPFSGQSAVHNLVLDISPDFAIDATVLVGTFSGLGISTDGGETWRELDTRPPTLTMGLAISPNVTTDQTMFAA
ncbi:MAG: YCF48-related protein, partial [Pseudomonadota bacterium]